MENQITISLAKPLANGKTELVLDFDSLNGYALIQCEKDAKREDTTIIVPTSSQIYLARVAAAACGVRYDDVCSLPGGVFTKVTLETRNFLLNTGV